MIVRFYQPRPPDSLLLGHTARRMLADALLVPAQARSGHMYVIGKTGKGKSKFLLSCIVQDIAAGRACGVIDPHSDLIADVLRLLHARGVLDNEAIRQKILYLDPTSKQTVMPFNVLATSGDPYVTAQNIIEAFRRTWPDTLASAPNFENNMLYALLLLITTGRRLIELPRLWTDVEFRRELLEQAGNGEITAFFEGRVDQWGREGPLRLESMLNKVTALTMNPYLKLMLGQADNILDFRRLMDEGIILLADLGHCDEESQKLIGNLITTSMEQAIFSRHDTPPEQRRPYYLYIDEFQDFSAGAGSVKTFSKILSGARKMGLHLIIAHQNLSQLSPRLKGAVLGNVWTKVIFGISEEDAYEFARWIGLGTVDTGNVKHAAQSESQHPMYMPLAEQYLELATQLANQLPRQATLRDHAGYTNQIWTLNIKALQETNTISLIKDNLKMSGLSYSEAVKNVAKISDEAHSRGVDVQFYD